MPAGGGSARRPLGVAAPDERSLTPRGSTHADMHRLQVFTTVGMKISKQI